eukprot:1630451-Rhodomonas_salina.2
MSADSHRVTGLGIPSSSDSTTTTSTMRRNSESCQPECIPGYPGYPGTMVPGYRSAGSFPLVPGYLGTSCTWYAYRVAAYSLAPVSVGYPGRDSGAE